MTTYEYYRTAIDKHPLHEHWYRLLGDTVDAQTCLLNAPYARCVVPMAATAALVRRRGTRVPRSRVRAAVARTFAEHDAATAF